MTVVLRPISAVAAEAILAGRAPEDVRVAPDYPTEFSSGVAERVGAGARLGPYFVHRAEDDVVVGEIGGAFMDPVTVGIGYAIVRSCWGNGYATDAVRALVARALQLPEIELIVAFTPLDRPASGRVLRKAGFTPVGEEDDEHEGKILRVIRWELATEYARAVDDVLREERALQAAMLASDVEALDRLLHPELLAVGPDGRLVEKAEDLEAHRSGVFEIYELDEEDVRVRVAGDTAVTFVVLLIRGAIAGEEVSGRMRYTRTWSRDDGAWRVLAAHIAPAA